MTKKHKKLCKCFVCTGITWNKNTKGIMKANKTSFKKGEHPSIKTEFKKGQPPINKLSIGTITIRQSKNDTQRKWIKIKEPNTWIEHARYIYIKHNGKITKRDIIHHIDGNSLNDDINNLLLTTRKEHFNKHNIGELGRIAVTKKTWKKNALVVAKN